MILDRYVLRSWIRIFLLTAVGAPLVSVLIRATDRLSHLLDRQVATADIVLSFAYSMPEEIARLMPAACLFATVFTLGPLSRYSELTAAKAGGLGLYRLIRPLILVAALASVASFFTAEYATRASARALELQKEQRVRALDSRYNFVFRADQGWVFTVRLLDIQRQRMQGLVFERAGAGPEYPTLAAVADSAVYADTLHGRWRLLNGSLHVIRDSASIATFRYDQLRLMALTQSPRELLVEPKDPDEMDYAELGEYITLQRRSGGDVRRLEVERALKLAVPAACLVVALFGAPLAVSSPRSGAALGIAVSLGTTVAYLLMIQLTRAVGQAGVIGPELAAWTPNIFFSGLAVVLLVRVRT